jgi:hypothetical protein
MSTTPEQFNAIDEAFLREVTEALKGDHNDLRREAIILRASREARRASVTAQAERTIALEVIMREALDALQGVIRVADRKTVEFDAAKAAADKIRAALEHDKGEGL